MSSISATNRTAVFTMMKNERDIIGDFLDQVLELFDFIYILDHESRDGTYEVCRQVAAKDDRVRLYRLASSGYPQAQVTTWFSHEIFRRDEPEWLFLLDADEFLPFDSRKEFRTALGRAHGGKCLGMEWRNIIPADLDDWKGLSATTFLETSKGGFRPKVVIHRAVMEKIGDKLTVFQGNHGVGLDEIRRAEMQDAPFTLFHLPYRSMEQAEQKLLLGNLAYYNDPWRRLGKGFHWVQMADEYYVSAAARRSALRDQVLHYSWLAHDLKSTDEESFAPCRHQFRFPQACDRSVLEQSSHLTSALIMWREVERLMATGAATNNARAAAEGYVISDVGGTIVKIVANRGETQPGAGENGPSNSCGTDDDTRHRGGAVGAERPIVEQAAATPGAEVKAAAPAAEPPVFHTEAARQLSIVKQVFGWMNTPPRAIPPSAWSGHLAFLHALIGLARPRRIVELGVLTGCSFFAMCDACQAHGLDTELIGIDQWTGDPHTGQFNGDTLFKDLCERMFWTYPMARLIRSDFTSARQRVPDGVVDLLHIDGYHTLEAVSGDFSTWFSALSERGICMFHDIAVRERDFGVYLLWEELKSKWPYIEFPHCFGLGILFVGQDQPPAVREFLGIWNSSELVRESLRSAAELFASTFPIRVQAMENEKELRRVGQEREEFLQSLSWRITAPLRSAGRIAQRLLKGRSA